MSSKKKALTPGQRVVIRTACMAPWCHVANEQGSGTDEHLHVADNTEGIVFYDVGGDCNIGVVFATQDCLRAGFF